MNEPLCGCHGAAMRWNKDGRGRGYWRCNVRDAEWARNRYHDPAHAPAVLRKLMRKQLLHHQKRSEGLNA